MTTSYDQHLTTSVLNTMDLFGKTGRYNDKPGTANLLQGNRTVINNWSMLSCLLWSFNQLQILSAYFPSVTVMAIILAVQLYFRKEVYRLRLLMTLFSYGMGRFSFALSLCKHATFSRAFRDWPYGTLTSGVQQCFGVVYHELTTLRRVYPRVIQPY